MKFVCDKCKAEFSRKDALKRHSRKHDVKRPSFKCRLCADQFTRQEHLRRHVSTKHAPSNTQSNRIWRPDPDVMDDLGRGGAATTTEPEQDLDADRHQEVESIVGALWRPWEDRMSIDLPEDTMLQALIQQNFEQIKTHKTITRRLQDRYNFQTRNPTTADVRSYLLQIAGDQTVAFKLNMSFGFVLMHKETKQLVYYYASQNSRAFEKPVTVSSESDVEKVIEKFETTDLLEYCRTQRPNSSYVVIAITNLLFYVNKMKNFLMGAARDLPEHVKRHQAIISLDRDHRGRLYKDNFCLFRCLALHRGHPLRTIDREIGALVHQWRTHRNEDVESRFGGVGAADLPDFEDLFSVNVEGLSLNLDPLLDPDGLEDPEPVVAVSHILRSRMSHNSTMYTHVHKNHFSFVTDPRKLARCWKCRKCSKLFNQRSRMMSHERNCKNQTRYKYRGGGYGPRKDVFDLLVEAGVPIKDDDKFYPYRITYDFEAAITEVDNTTAPRAGIKKKLTPVSVALCSNVPGYEEPRCLVSDGSPYDLIKDMNAAIREISDRAYSLMSAKLKYVTDKLEAKMKTREELDEDGTDPDRAFRLRKYSNLHNELQKWMKRIVVMGFNSGKFDINLIRNYLFPSLLQDGVPIRTIIKKGKSYLSIVLDHCMFLDISNYLAPNTSYAKWLRSCDIAEEKGHFPYEWLTKVEDLETPYLVSKECFWSTLKQKGISDVDYEHIKAVWSSRGFKTMRDLLVWYNCLDVAPFQLAAEKMFQYWKALKIDPFKGGAISLPGLALNHLVNNLPKHTVLPLFPERFKDVLETIQGNITGGLASVQHRYHEVGKTTLPNGQITKLITSRDANGLYLYALGEPMGTGVFALWRASDANTSVELEVSTANMDADAVADWKRRRHANLSQIFRRRSSYPYHVKELEWLEWYSHTNNCRVQHRFNGGQKCISRSSEVSYPVDGYIAENQTVLQFHGCYWHGHGCSIDSGANVQRRLETEEISRFLRDQGYNVVEMWECQWDKAKEASSTIKDFVRTEVNLPDHPRSMSGYQLLGRIRAKKLFGLIECDVEVPAWRDDLREYFKEFPPIFKNVEVSRDDIGDFMKTYAEQNDFLRKPQRCLISSYWARKILLTTDMLRWLLEKGLEVSRICQVIEMKPKQCFAHLRDEVSHHRRQADRDPAYKPVGENWKLIGNNYYGKTATNKKRHKQTTVGDMYEASRKLNNKRFCEMEDLGSDYYEVTMDKNSITFDLPVTVAFFVYMTSKLRMLEFVFDFLKKFFTAGSYQLVCTDTDSIVAAYSSDNLDDIVRPELRDEYIAVKPSFLVTDDYSLRTPGLFKVEAEGSGVIALCAKTYIIWSEGCTKMSCKGLSKTTKSFSEKDYMEVLNTGQRGGGKNYGFKILPSGVYQYEQHRRGLSYLYTKRKVRGDGVTTEPLDL